MRVGLTFSPRQITVQRRRLEYAFRLFCAVHGHDPLVGDPSEQSADLWLSYRPLPKHLRVLQLSDSYQPRDPSTSAPPPSRFTRGDDETVLFYKAESGAEPDWLGEIFEWASCADEYNVSERDSVGRVPFKASYVGRHVLDPARPYGSVAMSMLQRAMERGLQIQSRAHSAEGAHLVANTHDVDYLPGGRMASVYQLLKYSLQSLLLQRSLKRAREQAGLAFRLAGGGSNALDQLGQLLHLERAHRVSSSYFFVCQHHARRDGNYDVHSAQMRGLLSNLESDMEVGVHGSYRSLDEPDGLAREFEELRAMGFRPLGGRQHWLRFTLPSLIRGVTRAGAAYDASCGWTNTIGFRAGLCCPFPPYDFDKEGPAPFLELPLVMMDHGVECAGRLPSAQPDLVHRVLAASRRYGWGGISVLWHPTAFGGGQFPTEVGDTYWNLLDGARDKWQDARTLVRSVWHRYSDAGLLPERSFA
jgi:hypothetical protein